MIRTNKLNKWKRTHVRLLVDKKGNFTEITKDAADSLANIHSTFIIEKLKDEYLSKDKGGRIIARTVTLASAVYDMEPENYSPLCEDALDELERTAAWFVTYTIIYA